MCELCDGKGVVRQSGCPFELWDNDLSHFSKIYNNYKETNSNPFSGSYMDQNFKVFEAFNLLDSYIGMLNERKREIQESNSRG